MKPDPMTAPRPTDAVDLDAHRPHMTGNAQCRKCAHGWVAVIIATANPWLLECPRCCVHSGHLIGAFPESPFQAKVWAEEMWRYLTDGTLPSGDGLNASQTNTDGDAGSAGDTLTSPGNILTVSRSRWTTSPRSSSAGQIGSTTSAPPTSDATADEEHESDD